MSPPASLPALDVVSGEEWDDIETAMRAAAEDRSRRRASVGVPSFVDMEDVVPDVPRAVTHRPRGLKVTDLAAQEWCERELAFTLVRGRVETAAMAATRRHAELEAEVMERVEVAVETAEDRWAVRALDAHVGLEQLRGEGMTRELPVFGWLLPDGDAARDASFAVGIVDELWLDRSRPASRARLVDHKARVSRALPTEAQARTTRVQLMAYKTLFDGLVRRGVDPGGRLSARIGLEETPPSPRTSPRVAEVLPALGADAGTASSRSATSSTPSRARSRASSRPRRLLFVEYEWQRGGEPLGSASFDHDERWFTARAKTHVSFWDGSRDAGSASTAGRPVVHGVADDEAWKCERCRFRGLSHRRRLRRAVGAREEGEKGDRRGRVSSGRRASRRADVRGKTREPTSGRSGYNSRADERRRTFEICHINAVARIKKWHVAARAPRLDIISIRRWPRTFCANLEDPRWTRGPNAPKVVTRGISPPPRMYAYST